MTIIRFLVRNYLGSLVGMTAFYLQRITGILLLFYLLVHVETVHQLSAGPVAFDRAMARFHSLTFRLLEIGLLGAVILHAMNGIRLTILDLGIGHRHQKALFWGLAVGAGALLFLAGAVPMFLHSVLRR